MVSPRKALRWPVFKSSPGVHVGVAEGAVSAGFLCESAPRRDRMILTVTFNPAVDHTALIDGDLEAGAVTRGHDAVFDAAGKGINVTKYLTGMGYTSVATGPIGGFLGDFVEEDLDRQGASHDFVRVEGLTRLNTTVDAPDAEYKINLDGPTMPDDVEERLLETVERHDPDIVVLGGSMPPGMDEAIIDHLSTGDWRTAIDVHGEILGRREEAFFFAKPNREELEEATDMSVETQEQLLAAADRLREQGMEQVLVSLGEDGAIYVTENGAFRADALDVDVADTVGAGDAAVAGAISAIEDGSDDEEVLKRAIAASSRVVAMSGVSIPDFDAIDDLADAVRVEQIR